MLCRGIVLTEIGLLGLLLVGCRETTTPASGELSFREQIARAKEEPDTELRRKRLIKIGYQQGKAKDIGGADDTLELAWKVCDSIDDPVAKASSLALMAEANAALDQDSAATRAIDAALDAAANVEPPEKKAQSLARVAQAQGPPPTTATGPRPRSDRPKSSSTKSTTRKARRCRSAAIAKAYHKAKMPAERDRVIGLALEYAKSLGDARKRSLALADVAEQQSGLDDRAAATKTFDLALASADKIDIPYSKVYALGDVAEKLAEAGFPAKARDVLNQAERLTTKIPQSDIQMQALQHVRRLMNKLPNVQ